MSQILVRNVEPKTVERLKANAAASGRSLEAEIRRILDREARWAEQSTGFWAATDAFRAELAGTEQTDSALMRHDGRQANDAPMR